MKNNLKKLYTIFFVLICLNLFALNNKKINYEKSSRTTNYEYIANKLLSTKEFEGLVFDYSIVSLSIALSGSGEYNKINENFQQIEKILKTPYEYLTDEKKQEVASLFGYSDFKILENRLNQLNLKKEKLQNLVPELQNLPDNEKQDIINMALEKGKILDKINAAFFEDECVKKCSNEWYSCKKLNNIWRYVTLGIMTVCFAAYLTSIYVTAGTTLTLWQSAMVACGGGAFTALGLMGYTGNTGCNSDLESCLKICHPEYLAGGN